MEMIVVARSDHAHGRPAGCCRSKVLEGQVILQLRLAAARFEDPWLYLHAECVDHEIAQAPPGRPVGGIDQAFNRILASAGTDR
ncbi:MAG: hypothetical protein AAGC63_11560 [Propionicimonas sp.]